MRLSLSLRAVAFLLLLALVGCGTTGGTRPQTDQTEDTGATGDEVVATPQLQEGFERATQLLRDGQYQEGVVLLERLLRERGAHKSAGLHINRGIAYERLGKLEQAEEALKAALAIQPDHPVANNEYGMVLRRSGRFTEARAVYERALEKSPGFLPARRNLGILCDLYLRDPECAMTHYQAYAAAVPEDKSVAAWIADLQQKMNR